VLIYHTQSRNVHRRGQKCRQRHDKSPPAIVIRFGPRYDADCANLTMKNGEAIAWVSTCRYLGVYFVSGRELKCCFDQAKQKFFVHLMLFLEKWDALRMKRFS